MGVGEQRQSPPSEYGSLSKLALHGQIWLFHRTECHSDSELHFYLPYNPKVTPPPALFPDQKELLQAFWADCLQGAWTSIGWLLPLFPGDLWPATPATNWSPCGHHSPTQPLLASVPGSGGIKGPKCSGSLCSSNL